MCGLDLKDQFLHVPINKTFHKFLRFTWLDTLLEWVVLPFGLRCSPRVITKILKPVMAFLRTTWGILISIYIDNMLIQAGTAAEAFHHAQLTALLLMVLGWSLNWEKSSFTFTGDHTPWLCVQHQINDCKVPSSKGYQIAECL